MYWAVIPCAVGLGEIWGVSGTLGGPLGRGNIKCGSLVICENYFLRSEESDGF